MSELQDETHGYMVKTTPRTTVALKPPYTWNSSKALISSSREIRAPFLTCSGNTKSFFHVPGTKLLPVYDRASCIVPHRIGGQDYINPLPFSKNAVSQWKWNWANICIGGNGILDWDQGGGLAGWILREEAEPVE